MSSTSRFLYKGPNSGITINAVDYMLFDGSEVALPADDEHVAVLVHEGYLTAVEAVATEPAPVALSTTSAVDTSDKKRK